MASGRTYAQCLEDEIAATEETADDLVGVVRDLRDGDYHDMADDLVNLGRQLRVRALDLRGRLAAHRQRRR